MMEISTVCVMMLCSSTTASYEPCWREMSLPCSVEGVDYIRYDERADWSGIASYTCSVPALREHDSTVLSIEFIRGAKEPLTESESDVTNRMYNLLSNAVHSDDFDFPFPYNTVPTLKLSQYEEHEISHGIYHTIKVSEFHPFGDVSTMLDGWLLNREVLLSAWARSRDEYILKFMFDLSFVLRTLSEQFMINRDVKLRNVLVAGDVRDPAKTVFVQSEYAMAISKGNAKKLLSADAGTESAALFCSYGPHVKSLRVWHYQMSQLMFRHRQSTCESCLERRLR